MYGKLTSWAGRGRPRTQGAARRRGLMTRRDFDALECRTLLSLAIVKDVNTVDSAPANITLDNGNVFYTTHDPAGGFDLQMTTSSGTTTLLKSFSTPGPYGGSSIANLTAVGTKLFFSATSGDGTELWSTDGTAANTTEVKDIAPGTKSSNPAHLTSFNGALFFTADAAGGTGATAKPIVWTSDGTAAGTVAFKDAGNNPIPNVNQFVASGASLVFTNGTKLYQTDGTSAGTTTLKTFTANTVSGLTPVGTSVFFAADDGGGTGTELWKDTTGTVTEVKDIRAGATGSYPNNLTNVGGKLFFTAFETTDGTELWTSDGTAAGTKLVKDIFTGTTGSYPNNLTAVGGNLFFSASDGSGGSASGQELWTTNGTTLATTRLKDIDPATNFTGSSLFASSGGLLYFSNNDGTNGYELWKSDGTPAGTTLLKDINPGAASSFPSDLTDVNGTLYFSAHDNTGGNQLWKSGGTAATTVKVQTFNPAATQGALNVFPGSTPNVATLGNSLIFPANDGALGTELYKSDGTTAGTTLLKDIVPGLQGSYPYLLTTAGTQAFFTADVPVGGTTVQQLWVTDGTAAGTKKVIDSPTFSISNLTALGSKLFFTQFDTTHGTELWVTDGTPLNTNVIDIDPGTGSSNPQSLTPFNGKLYFAANDGTVGTELWMSDGTAAGTTLVKDIRTGATVSNPYNLTVFGNSLFFTANDGNSANEIWKSDGTKNGTTLFTTLTKAATENIGNLTVAGANSSGTPLMFFTAADGTNTGALWVTDGTAAGTVVVSDVKAIGFPGFTATGQTLVSLNNGKVVFVANDGTTGQEPWVSDGTSGGTTLLRDVNPGNSSSISYTRALLVNGKVYFGATDGTKGTELWQTDGTQAGTIMTQDINPGGFSSNPIPIGTIGGKLAVAADDGTHGLELLVDQPPTLAAIPNQSATAGTTASFKAVGAAGAPGVTVTYSLGTGAPAGATIDPNTGAFSWAVPANQAVGNVPVTVVVTENTPAMESVSQVVQIAIGSANHAPTLAAITSPQTTSQGATFTVTAMGSDQDAGQTLTYTLNAGTTGATIDPAKGIITWAVPLAQAVGDYPVSVTVTDNGNPPLSSAPQNFTIHVNAANHAPTLAAITSPQTATQGAAFTVTAVGADQDAGQTVTYTLNPGTTGATIDPAKGIITWAVPAAQAVGDYPVSVTVTDNGTPPLSSAPQAFTIHVNALNHAPTLAAIAPQTVNEGTPVTASAVGMDQDAGQTVTYSLTGTVPTGAAIDPKSGAITYTPLTPGTVSLMVIATDNGTPALSSAPQTFTITVTNVTPTVSITPGASVRQHTTFSTTGSFTDPGTETWTATVDYGDGTGAQNLALSGKTFALSHPYAAPGNYTITVKVNDGTGIGTGTQTIPVKGLAKTDFAANGSDGIGIYQWNTGFFALSALNPGKYTIGPQFFPKVGGAFDPTAIPITGDFNGDGITDIGLYIPGKDLFELALLDKSGNVTNTVNITYGYHDPGVNSVPVTGDWGGTGVTGIGVYLPASDKFALGVLTTQVTVAQQIVNPYGYHTGGVYSVPVTGDWAGNGTTGVGIYIPTDDKFAIAVLSPGQFAIAQQLVNSYGYHDPGVLSVPVTGDWAGNGTTGIGIYLPASDKFALAVLSPGQYKIAQQIVNPYGYHTGGVYSVPVTGDWAGNGTTGVGIYLPTIDTFAIAVLSPGQYAIAQQIVNPYGFHTSATALAYPIPPSRGGPTGISGQSVATASLGAAPVGAALLTAPAPSTAPPSTSTPAASPTPAPAVTSVPIRRKVVNQGVITDSALAALRGHTDQLSRFIRRARVSR